VSNLPGLTRLVFDMPKAVSVALKANGDTAELAFDAPLRLAAGDAKAQLAPAVLDLRSEADEGAMRVWLTLAPGHEIRGFRDDDSYVLDIVKPKPTEAPAAAGPVLAVEPALPAATARSAGQNASAPPEPVRTAPRPAVKNPRAGGAGAAVRARSCDRDDRPGWPRASVPVRGPHPGGRFRACGHRHRRVREPGPDRGPRLAGRRRCGGRPRRNCA
jgi:hypothetical protein